MLHHSTNTVNRRCWLSETFQRLSEKKINTEKNISENNNIKAVQTCEHPIQLNKKAMVVQNIFEEHGKLDQTHQTSLNFFANCAGDKKSPTAKNAESAEDCHSTHKEMKNQIHLIKCAKDRQLHNNAFSNQQRNKTADKGFYHVQSMEANDLQPRTTIHYVGPPKLNLVGVQYQNVSMLPSMTISVRKVGTTSNDKKGIEGAFSIIDSSSGGRAQALSFKEGTEESKMSNCEGFRTHLRTLTAGSESSLAVGDTTRIPRSQLVHLFHDSTKDCNQSFDRRYQTDSTVQNRRSKSEDDKNLSIREISEKMTPLLVRTISFRQRRKIPRQMVNEESLKCSIPPVQNTNVITNQITPLTKFITSMAIDHHETNFKPITNEHKYGKFDTYIEKISNQQQYMNENKYKPKDAANEVADILCRSVKIAKTQKFTEVNGHKLLLDLAKNVRSDSETFNTCLEAFAKGSDVDPFIRDFCVWNVEPEIDPEVAAQDPKGTEAYVALMTDALIRPRKKKSLHASDAKYPLSLITSNLDLLLNTWNECKDNDDIGLKNKLQWLKEIYGVDWSGLSLKEVHSILCNRKYREQTVLLNEDRSLRRLFDFIYETMDSYLRTSIEDAESYHGQEVMYGCLCFQILLEEPQNETYLIDHKIPELLLNGMKVQTNLQITQHVILSALELCLRGSNMHFAFANHPYGPIVVTEVLYRGALEVGDRSPLEAKDLMKPRLELVQRMAYNRQVFAETSIMCHLITMWNDSDHYYFGEVQNRNVEDLKRLYKREKREIAIEYIGTALKKGLIHTTANTGGILPPSSLRQPLGSVTDANRALKGSPLRYKSTIDVSNNNTVQILTNFPRLDKKNEGIPSSTIFPVVQEQASMMPQNVTVTRVAAPGSVYCTKPAVGSMCSDFSTDASSGIEDEWVPHDVGQGPVMMPHLLKTMRKVVCEQTIRTINANESSVRLVGLVVDRETDPALLPDILFLIGAFTDLPELKDYLGKINAVERILDLIRRAYKNNSLHMSEIVGNSCLALSNLCINHVYNTNRFNKYKGSELIVKTLRQRGSINDATGVNGASALMCNLCFKNEYMKKSLGHKGACEALTQAMRDYKSSGAQSGSRCISSMFKAIGNISLNAYNMSCFLQADIPSAYADFLEEADDELDDATLEACFRTLANLVIEKDNMEKFEASVVPVLSVIRKIQKTTPEIYRWAFETIGNLCRWPESAKVFSTNEGIQTILSLLPFLTESANLHLSAIFVLGNQTSNKANIPILIRSGIFDFVRTILDNYWEQCHTFEATGEALQGCSIAKKGLPNTQLPIAALRCTKRVLETKQNANECLIAGIPKSILKGLPFFYSNSMMMYEALTVIFRMIAFYSGKETPTSSACPSRSPNRLIVRTSVVPAFRSRATKLTQTAVAMRQMSMLAQPKDKSDLLCARTTFHVYGDEDQPRHRVPIGDRAWQLLLLSDSDIDGLIEFTRRALAERNVSRNLRLYRLGIGCLTYFACEKKGFDALYRRLEFDNEAEEPPTQGWDMQRRRNLQPATPPSSPPTFDDTTKAFRKRKPIIYRLKGNNKQHQPQMAEFGFERPRDKTCIIDLVFHALETFTSDRLIGEETIILLNHMVLCATTSSELESIADRTFYKEMKALPLKDDFFLETRKEALKLYELMLDKGHGFKVEDKQEFNHLVDIEFPLDLSGWNDDPYPDGVQSLPNEIKEFLRNGGTLDSYSLFTTMDGNSELEKKGFLWKATHDLTLFQWKYCDPKKELDDDPRYPFSVAISLVNAILPAGTNTALTKLLKKRSINESSCISILGPVTAEFPNRLVLNLRAKNHKQRDSLVHVFTLWRDSAAYGFR